MDDDSPVVGILSYGNGIELTLISTFVWIRHPW